MLHEIGRELETAIAAKGCPFKVKDREATKPTAWRNIILIEHVPGADTFGPPQSQSRNAKRYYEGQIAGKLTIHAQSTKSGALEFEHRRLAYSVADVALVELRRVCNDEDRRQGFSIGRCGLATVADLEASEVQGGAVYEINFTVGRAVFDRTFTGEIADEFTIDATNLETSTLASLAQGPDDDDDPNTPPAAAEEVTN